MILFEALLWSCNVHFLAAAINSHIFGSQKRSLLKTCLRNAKSASVDATTNMRESGSLTPSDPAQNSSRLFIKIPNVTGSDAQSMICLTSWRPGTWQGVAAAFSRLRLLGRLQRLQDLPDSILSHFFARMENGFFGSSLFLYHISST